MSDAQRDHLLTRTSPRICPNCSCYTDKAFLFVEPVFAPVPDSDGNEPTELPLKGLVTMAIAVCCGDIRPTTIQPAAVIKVMEHLSKCSGNEY